MVCEWLEWRCRRGRGTADPRSCPIHLGKQARGGVVSGVVSGGSRDG